MEESKRVAELLEEVVDSLNQLQKNFVIQSKWYWTRADLIYMEIPGLRNSAQIKAAVDEGLLTPLGPSGKQFFLREEVFRAAEKLNNHHE